MWTRTRDRVTLCVLFASDIQVFSIKTLAFQPASASGILMTRKRWNVKKKSAALQREIAKKIEMKVTPGLPI